MLPDILGDFVAAAGLQDPGTAVVVLGLLSLGGLAAGFVDAIAGGGGIITVPALLASGLPPHLALGTNKLQASFGSSSAALGYRRKGLVRFRSTWPGVLAAAAGSAFGTWLVGLLSPGFLKLWLPLALGAVALFLLFRPRRKARPGVGFAPGGHAPTGTLEETTAFVLGGVVIGFYDGFIGPGTGTFWVLFLMQAAAMDIQGATARTKVFNFTSNVVSLAVFAAAGSVVLLPGLLMGLGQAAGAALGSHLAVKQGEGFIRFMLGLTTLGMLVWVVVRQST